MPGLLGGPAAEARPIVVSGLLGGPPEEAGPIVLRWTAGPLLALLLVACDDARHDFHSGRELVLEGHYADAIAKLERYLAARPDGKLASRAQFFVAKAYLGLGALADARSAFQRTRIRYPGSHEAHKARYKLALLDLIEGEHGRAADAFASLAAHPDGALAPEASAMARYLGAGGVPQEP